MNNTFRNFFRQRANRVRYMRLEDFGICSLLRATVLNERVLFVTPDVRAVATGPAVKHGQVNVDNGTSSYPDPSWHPGKYWLDPYHVNPFTENPLDRV